MLCVLDFTITLLALVVIKNILVEKVGSGAQSILKVDPEKVFVGTKSDQLVNICSFAVRCDRRWPSTQ